MGSSGRSIQRAMPVILTDRDEVETWLTKPWQEAKALQRPLADDRLVIVPEPETQVIARQLRGW